MKHRAMYVSAVVVLAVASIYSIRELVSAAVSSRATGTPTINISATVGEVHASGGVGQPTTRTRTGVVDSVTIQFSNNGGAVFVSNSVKGTFVGTFTGADVKFLKTAYSNAALTPYNHIWANMQYGHTVKGNLYRPSGAVVSAQLSFAAIDFYNQPTTSSDGVGFFVKGADGSSWGNSDENSQNSIYAGKLDSGVCVITVP